MGSKENVKEPVLVLRFSIMLAHTTYTRTYWYCNEVSTSKYRTVQSIPGTMHVPIAAGYCIVLKFSLNALSHAILRIKYLK
jgi:hypothetical protein